MSSVTKKYKKRKQIEYTRGHACVYKLQYHLILVVKYRVKVIDKPIFDEILDVFTRVGKFHSLAILEANYEADHIHLLIEVSPQTTISRYINSAKSASSRIVKNKFPGVRQKLWKEYFWSRSYCILSSGGAPIETIRKYIQEQYHEN